MPAARKQTAPAAPRLSSAQRHTQIMDSATALILQRGLLHCTLEEVAVAAGISKALIYRHFSSRDELLKALLEREFSVLRGHGLGAFAPDATFEHIVRVSTEKAFAYLHERGAILRELFSDRSAVQLLQARDREERMASTRFFVDESIRTYRVPPEVAQIIAVITINAPAAAARGLRKFGFDPRPRPARPGAASRRGSATTSDRSRVSQAVPEESPAACLMGLRPHLFFCAERRPRASPKRQMHNLSRS